MKLRTIERIILVVILSAVSSCLAWPQAADSYKCSTTYEDRNQADYTLRVHAIQGTGEIDVGHKKRWDASDACYILFTDQDHKLVASFRGAIDGHFGLKGAPDFYRLVARAETLCPANMRLQVIKSSRSAEKILVHFVAQGIDDCSYGEVIRVRRKHPTNALQPQ